MRSKTALREEAWCRNPDCELCGEGMDEADLTRCPSCGVRLAVEEVRVPVPMPDYPVWAKAAA